ncbi:toll/interleukin-1 receptor domain-containing protein [Bifidobacterium amazonense]|uniref:Toll/interleukin-1 receptor domain-containing protein n=1 Tax=Bifidobacterium amazonense TaxID=2809027 RepID=A0ABS9VY07_9BIFI|nr:toll/interleukin-1 receptor domain-containing protein [Bifidobacterium amazonense]MCH9277004.1 toll/interleukin-1 receptor domain-containing protein [Bifidobacterium amazonense]
MLIWQMLESIENRITLFSYDVFIPYAWSSERSEWVHLLASHLHLIGFSVGLDRNLPYGSNLDKFMNAAFNARHVLMVLDYNYIQKANALTWKSGVLKENEIVQRVFESHPADWLACIVIDNPRFQFPSWLVSHNPKSFDFNDQDVFSDKKIEDLWRWIAGFPADKTNAVSPSVIRERLERVEKSIFCEMREIGQIPI